MSSTYGENLKLSIFGQSHGAAIGMTLDGIGAGLPVNLPKLQTFLDRRAPGNAPYATSRKESDAPEFLSGIVDGYTCGAPIAAMIRNNDNRSSDYDNLKVCPRPGHADYTAQIKYGGYQDIAGGGHFSGRLTAPLCIAGGLCLQWLEEMGIQIRAHIASIGDLQDDTLDSCTPNLESIGTAFPVINPQIGAQMQEKIAQAKAAGDSIGGSIACYITGVPAGVGEPMFGGIESKLSQILFGIPAVKAVEFGAGFDCTKMYGSNHNDPFTVEDGKVKTTTNNAGGILGGIANGMPITFRVAVKPTPSIALAQNTVDMKALCQTQITVHGRHDPCIVPRAVPVVEAAAAIAIYDAILSQKL